jgi:hypothetical protein
MTEWSHVEVLQLSIKNCRCKNPRGYCALSVIWPASAEDPAAGLLQVKQFAQAQSSGLFLQFFCRPQPEGAFFFRCCAERQESVSCFAPQ